MSSQRNEGVMANFGWSAIDRPSSETDWLMQPYEIQPNLDDAHQDSAAMAIDHLSERSRCCIESIYFEQVSYAALGRRLGHSKTHAWRLTRKAIAELRLFLSKDEVIIERYAL